MEMVWVFRLIFIGVLCTAFLMALFFAVPRILKNYTAWKETKKDRYLELFFTHLFLALFLFSAVFVVLLKKFSDFLSSYAS
ncbi:MAG: hypothetical protein A3E80_00220 [Chlamydiae bacterium RIFCSPHIGHO2_12_FULL_49_9]|nr:MAG: hypothetical protein A3E80_00220 [Chlamydiae bacterium RIFCSPHIGHO2_12_FULL_49_9]